MYNGLNQIMSDKPDSVHLQRRFIIYLSNQPTDSDGAILGVSLCDLATRKVYPSRQITLSLVSSYLTFSPLPVCLEEAPSAV